MVTVLWLSARAAAALATLKIMPTTSATNPLLSRDFQIAFDRIKAADVEATEEHVGPAYGAVTAAGREALDLLARTEGTLLDPAYTAKAMAGLIADVRSGWLTPGRPVVFLHTGGTPAVFAYRDELMATV